MKVLALGGSPRRGGNSDLLADEFLRGAKEAGAEVDKVYLDDQWIRPIGEVSDATGGRLDPRDDDDFPRVLARFLEADIVVFATPVYWAGVSAQTKCFIDRLSSYFRLPDVAPKLNGKGYAVLCTFGRADPSHGKFVTEPMRLCADVLGGRYLGDVSVSAHNRGQVKEKPEALQAAYELGGKAVRLMHAKS